MYWSLENVPWTNLHDLNLDWIVNTMKQTVEQWIAYRLEMNQKFEDFTEQINSDFDDFTTQINSNFTDFTTQINAWKTLIESEFSDLQTYVQNYFDNLDLNESTRYVINQMIASGEFIEVLNPSIVSTVEQWLADHITPTTPAVDSSLTIAGAAADAKTTGDKLNQLLDEMLESGAINILDLIEKNDHTSVGVTYTWIDEKTCRVSGTSTNTSYITIYNNQNGFPYGIEPGKSYYTSLIGGENSNFAIYTWKNDAITTLQITADDGKITIPADATGFLVRILVWNNTTVNETVTPLLLTAKTNKELSAIVEQLDTIVAGVKVKADKALLNEGTTPLSGYDDANNIPQSGVCFCGSSGGVADMANTPYAPCWIFTITGSANSSSFLFQLAYPYNATDKIQYRIKTYSGFTSWRVVSGGDTVTIEQEVSRDTYNNTYNITTNPNITTDSNGWLQPVDTNTADETGKTDMTGAIMSMLSSTGYCHLAPGIYYVSGNIIMPAGSMIEGCGKQTIIRLLQSTTSGYIVRMHTHSTLKNVCLSGGYSQGDISDGNIGGRKGINYIGNRDGQSTGVTPATCTCCVIDGCFFENLDSGFYGYNAGGGLQEGMEVTNCYFTRCKAGINIDYWTEYCKFTNCIIFQCYYACINNGGNNVFTACTFHGVIGFLIDNSSGNKQNIAHGTVNGCTFNHIDNMNNPSEYGKGYGVKVLNTVAGFIFANCQFWYGRVRIENSKGIQITSCEFGGISATYPPIETTGNDYIFIDNCLFQASPTLDIATPKHITNCWTYDGVAVT